MHWPSPFARGDQLMPKKNDKIEIGDADYVDVCTPCILLSARSPATDSRIQTWKAMEKAQKTGKTRAIGISNFSKAELERVLKEGSIVPAAHQIELHPWLQQHSFVEFNKSKGIHVQHYSPFGNQNEIYSSGQNMGKLMDDPVLVEVGKKYGKNGAQVALAWGIQNGHSVLPKSKTPSRIKSNLEGDFKLDKEDKDKINGIDKKLRFNDPSKNFGWNFYADLDGKK